MSKKRFPDEFWSDECEASFVKLKELLLTTAPVLGHPDFNNEFWVNVDASYKGLGRVLYEVNDKKKTVTAYANRTLCPIESQAKRSTFLELLDIKCLLTEPFKHFY